MSKTILTRALVASVLLALPLAAGADVGHEKKANSASEGEHADHRDGSMSQPGDLAGAWTALMAARDAIAGDVESGKLGDVHEKSEPLPGLVAALLEQSGDLDANKRTRVEGAAKQVTRVAEALHVAADGDDVAKTRKQLVRLDSLLELIQAQYPAGTLGTGAHAEEEHSSARGTEDHSAAHGPEHH